MQGHSAMKLFIGIMALASSFLPAMAGDFSAVDDPSANRPMQFQWQVAGPTETCGAQCRTWISATGRITTQTALDFAAFTENNDVEGATLVLDSEGGSVLAALALGRAIRRFNMTTTVGRTVTLPSVDGRPHAMLSSGASCESMCVFLLLAGTCRHVPPEAHVRVHMIWLGDKSIRAQEASYTAEELGLVQRDIGSIARYTVEMGGDIALLETALRIPPWSPLYTLTADEMRSMRLTTLDQLPPDLSPLVAQSARTLGNEADSGSMVALRLAH
jgi:hypothetical protein